MNTIQRCCPQAIADCLQMFIIHFSKKSGSKHKSQSKSIDQLQQEEFQFNPSSKMHHHQQQKPSKQQKQKKQEQKQEELEQNLSFKLSLNSHPTTQSQETVKLFQQHEETNLKLTNFNFKLNLEPYDPHYGLIESKTKKIQQIFQTGTKNILTRSSKSMINIQQIETLTGFKMLLSYRLPCSYAYFKRVNRDIQIISNINSIISENKIIETIHQNLTVNYLSFKKFMLLEPRCFNYVKYENSNQRNHWEICISVKGRPEIEPTEKQCDLTSISCFQERKLDLIVNTYLQVDLKSNLRANKVVLRVYQELANYIDKLYDYLAENYKEEEL